MVKVREGIVSSPLTDTLQLANVCKSDRNTAACILSSLSSVSVPDADTLDKGRAALRFQRPKCDQSRALRMQQVKVFNLIVRPS